MLRLIQSVKKNEALSYILNKGGITFGFRLVAMIFSFLTMWFITNFYGESTFGNYSLVLTILQITAMAFGLGIPNVFLSFTGEYNCDKKSKGLLFKVSKLVVLSSVVPSLLFLLFAGILANNIFSKPNLFPYLIIMSVSVSFMILHEIICYYFVSVKKYITYGLFIFIIPNVLFILFLIIFKRLELKEYYTFFAYVLSILITVLLGYLIVFFEKTKALVPTVSAKAILRKSLPMMMSGFFLVLLNWTDILMLGRLETESQIGIYNVAFKIGYLTLFFVVSMNVVIMPKVSQMYHENKVSDMKIIINRATQVVIILTIPLAIVLIVFSEYILSFFGTGFVAGSKTLIYITLGALFNAMTGNVDQILNMTNNQKLVRNILFVGFILNVILNVFFIPMYGIEGAALSSLITNIIVNSIFVYIIKRKLGFYTFM